MTHLLIFCGGLVALVVGASMLVRGASGLALRLGLSPLVIGLTVVAFGTSAPELAISSSAALSGQTGLAVGNVVGSNIFNVLFILGIAAIITPLAVHRQLIRQDVGVMMGGAVLLLLLVLGLDGGYGAFDGILLLVLLFGYTGFVVRQSRAQSAATLPQQAALAADSHWSSKLPAQLALIAVELVLLVVGSDAMVSSAVVFARAWGMSETVIGLTIVAAGTSLPEAATSIVASLKGDRDIAVGNVVGSCIFNVFGVVGVAALVASFSAGGWLPLPTDVAQFDLWVMLAALMVCLPLFITGSRIVRWEGLLLFGYYIAYTAYLVLAARRHEGAEAFGDAMLGFVIPLTIVTIGATLLRRADTTR